MKATTDAIREHAEQSLTALRRERQQIYGDLAAGHTCRPCAADRLLRNYLSEGHAMAALLLIGRL